MKRILAIIITYNGMPRIERCIDSGTLVKRYPELIRTRRQSKRKGAFL